MVEGEEGVGEVLEGEGLNHGGLLVLGEQCTVSLVLVVLDGVPLYA